jgi:GxxExxY protein
MPRIFDVIKGQAEHVMRVLGKGHSESVYHRALITALNKRGIAHRSEVACPIWFMGECIGMGRADLVVSDLVVEIKANSAAPKKTSPQLQKYILSLTQAEGKQFWGVVVNFNQRNGNVELYQDDQSKKEKTSELFKRSLEKETRESPRIFKKARR